MLAVVFHVVIVAAISSSALLAAQSSNAETHSVNGTANGQRISAGYGFTCAIREFGSVSCWGDNFLGQLGDGSTTDHAIPSMVWGIGEPVISLATGRSHACALTLSGAVKCWGRNNSGQLGDGTSNHSSVPVDVVGLSSGVFAISAGHHHTCASTLLNTLCWGSNFSGQLGDGSNVSRATPVPVLFLGAVGGIAAGRQHTCAIVGAQRGVFCWGEGSRGQLGDGAGAAIPFPMDPVDGLGNGVSRILAGVDHSCATLSATGGMRCWGANEYGQLGDGTTEDRLTPVDVMFMDSGVGSIAAGYYHTCGVQFDLMKCWGFNNTGRLGTGDRPDSLFPTHVVGLSQPVLQIAAGYGQTCAVHGPDSYSCWGNNLEGSVGNGSYGYASTPQDVIGLSSDVSNVQVGEEHVCALDKGGVYCWGDNRKGQLGDGTMVVRNTPVTVWGLESSMSAISVATNHGCALSQSGVAKCWGTNESGQLGDGTTIDSTIPVDVVGLGSGLLQLETGPGHSCALTATHGVKCWGENEFGQLGDGSTEARLTPVDVSGLATGVQEISVGNEKSCAILDTSSVKCWGLLPDDLGEPIHVLEPIDVPELGSNVTLLEVEGNTCVVNDGGALRCRGDNRDGLLGDGTTENSLITPVEVFGFGTGAISVSMGVYHACGVKTEGAAFCWGYNYPGVLGNGGTIESASFFPAPVVGLDSGVSSISAGFDNSCALLASGGVKCWGQNLYGQLGTGESGAVLLPTPVLMDEEIFRSGFD